MAKYNIVRVNGEYGVEEVSEDRERWGSYYSREAAETAAEIAATGKSVADWAEGPSLLEKNAFKSADLKDENNKNTKRKYKIKGKK